MYSSRHTYKSYTTFEITMLSTQILVQSYYLDAFSFHLSVKSHVFHVMYTDFSSILHLDSFSFHLLINLMFSMLSTQNLVQSYLGFIFIPSSVKSHVFHVMYTDFSSILHLDSFSFHLLINLMFSMLSTQNLVQSYTWTNFLFIFLLNLMFSMLSTQNLVQSYTWTNFQFIFLLNLIFTMLSTKIFVQSYTWIYLHSTYL